MPVVGTNQGWLDEPESPYPPQHLPHPGIEKELKPRPRYHGNAYRPADKLKGQVALITGGDSGIGRSVAVHYAKEGADVAIVYLPIEEPDAQETRQAVEQEGGSALLIPGDVSDPGFCRKAVQETLVRFGHLDILVNNAAYQQSVDSIEEVTLEEWKKAFQVNIDGYFYMTKAALEHMKEGGSVINSGSITGLEGNKALFAYSCTKGAIHAFTKSLAQMLVDRRIRVNCVAPGPVWTPLNPADRPAEEIAHFGEDAPYGRPAHPEEVAPAYVFFASAADSSYITGEVLTMLGGKTRAA